MFEHSTKNYLSVDPTPVGILRWLPAIVVFSVVGGFVALAWYAYHAGTQSMKDSDLLVVEADKTPIKEKPVDAGGMKFPDQDKTIFDTFSGNPKQPAKVERVLPVPEEPVAPPAGADTTETAGWINDKLHKKSDDAQAVPAKPEQVIVPVDNVASKDEDVVVVVKQPIEGQTAVPERQMAQTTLVPPEDQTTSYVAQTPKNPAVTPALPPKEESKPPVVKKSAAPAAMPPVTEAQKASSAKETATADVTVKPKEEPKAAIKKENVAPAAPADDKGVIKVQLGAYRSEKEAKDAWDVMLKKHAGLLADVQPSIVKADLGAKGIYYRLRVGKFPSPVEASVLCAKLTSVGQQCIIPVSK